MKNKSLWEEWYAILKNHQPVLETFREYLADYFTEVEEPPAGGYMTRPRLGLKLEIPDTGQILAVRPHWTKPKSTFRADRTGFDRTPGKINTQVITLELVGVVNGYGSKGKLLTLKLDGNEVKSVGRIWRNQDTNRQHLKTILDKAHGLLTNPLATFSQQADHCCRCGKALTDVVSRTRGIGPECITFFDFFQQEHPARQRYAKWVAEERDRYLQDTGLLPGL